MTYMIGGGRSRSGGLGAGCVRGSRMSAYAPVIPARKPLPPGATGLVHQPVAVAAFPAVSRRVPLVWIAARAVADLVRTAEGANGPTGSRFRGRQRKVKGRR